MVNYFLIWSLMNCLCSVCRTLISTLYLLPNMSWLIHLSIDLENPTIRQLQFASMYWQLILEMYWILNVKSKYFFQVLCTFLYDVIKVKTPNNIGKGCNGLEIKSKKLQLLILSFNDIFKHYTVFKITTNFRIFTNTSLLKGS